MAGRGGTRRPEIMYSRYLEDAVIVAMSWNSLITHKWSMELHVPTLLFKSCPSLELSQYFHPHCADIKMTPSPNIFPRCGSRTFPPPSSECEALCTGLGFQDTSDRI